MLLSFRWTWVRFLWTWKRGQMICLHFLQIVSPRSIMRCAFIWTFAMLTKFEGLLNCGECPFLCGDNRIPVFLEALVLVWVLFGHWLLFYQVHLSIIKYFRACFLGCWDLDGCFWSQLQNNWLKFEFLSLDFGFL